MKDFQVWHFSRFRTLCTLRYSEHLFHFCESLWRGILLLRDTNFWIIKINVMNTYNNKRVVKQLPIEIIVIDNKPSFLCYSIFHSKFFQSLAEDTEILRIALSPVSLFLFLRCALSHRLNPHNIQQTQSHQSIYKRSENIEILKCDAINISQYLTINTLLSFKRFSWLCLIYKVYIFIYIYIYIYCI